MPHAKPIFPLLLLLLPAQLFFPHHNPNTPPADWSDNMLLIPGGTFQMGSTDGKPNEQPVHAVTVSSFYLSKYEVTVADFKAFVEATQYKTDAEKEGKSWIFDGAGRPKDGVNWRYDAGGNLLPERDYNHPVIHVSWNDATEYCKWLTEKTGQAYRLPTEAEWEYAAGNGRRHTQYSWGNDALSRKKGGNVADKTFLKTFARRTIFDGYKDGFVFTAPVGSFEANDFGLCDMTGNVWEWCSDWFGADYYATGPADNPTGPASGTFHVLRGGSWSNNPDGCRVTIRFVIIPGYRDCFVGFRVARAF